MPDRKLSYKVDVDTGSAVSDLKRLGDAGGDAGKAIADGFDQAESASKAAFDALSSQLDQFEQDTKGAAAAIAAIKANLTVDVDDSKVAGFVSDLKSKMGVAFDDVTADAKQFADVLERGVDLSKTRNEIKGLGDELDHTRGEADQSRSVLANMAGNATQDLGELGGVAGTAGVAIGQLAEYASEGNISLKGLAGVAGPMALLAGATFVAKNVMQDWNAEAKRQEENVAALSDAMEDGTVSATDFQQAVRVEPDLLVIPEEVTVSWEDWFDSIGAVVGLGRDMVDVTKLLDQANISQAQFARAATGTIDDQAKVEAQLLQAREDGIITNQEYEDSLRALYAAIQEVGDAEAEHNALVQASMLPGAAGAADALTEALTNQLGPLAVLPDHWKTLIDDVSDGSLDFENATDLINQLADATGKTTDEVVALAVEQAAANGALFRDTSKLESFATALDNLGAANDAVAAGVAGVTGVLDDQASALQDNIDKWNDLIDAAHDHADAEQDFRDQTEQLPQVLADTSAALANSLPGEQEWIDSKNAQRDAIEDWVDGMVLARQESDKSNGKTRTAIQTQHDYAEGLGAVADKLDDAVIPSVAAYYASVLKIPDDKITDFEMVLATGDQAAIEAFIEANSGTFDASFQAQLDQVRAVAVAIALTKLAGPRTAPINAEPRNVYATDRALDDVAVDRTANIVLAVQNYWEWYNRIRALALAIAAVRNASANTSSSSSTSSAQRAVPAAGMLGVEPAATSFAAGGAGAGAVLAAPAPVTINLQAGVIGNRYDLSRWVRGALRDQQRLGRVS